MYFTLLYYIIRQLTIWKSSYISSRIETKLSLGKQNSPFWLLEHLSSHLLPSMFSEMRLISANKIWKSSYYSSGLETILNLENSSFWCIKAHAISSSNFFYITSSSRFLLRLTTEKSPYRKSSFCCSIERKSLSLFVYMLYRLIVIRHVKKIRREFQFLNQQLHAQDFKLKF